jgi:hypothetical protein
MRSWFLLYLTTSYSFLSSPRRLPEPEQSRAPGGGLGNEGHKEGIGND